MKKLILCSAILCTIALLQSCNNSNQQAETQPEVALQPNDSLFVVNEGGYNFQIILPKDLMISNTTRIVVNQSTGDLHIQLGEQFWIVASQEKTDMNNFKTLMNEDMLFTNKVMEETQNSLLVQRVLPDGTTYDYNFRSFSDVDGKPYIFKTSEEGEFSIESVKRMRHAITSVREKV